MKKWLWVLLSWYLTLPSWARLGGGSGFQSSSSSSGGGSGGTLLGFFFLLLIGGPAVYFLKPKSSKTNQNTPSHTPLYWMGVGFVGLVLLTNPPLLGLVALVFGVIKKRSGDAGVAQSTNLVSNLMNRLLSGESGGDMLLSMLTNQAKKPEPYAELLTTDPNFSLPVFREFAVLLYCQAIQEMASGEFVHARPYLSQGAAKRLQQRGDNVSEIRDIVVGSFQVRDAQTSGGRSIVNVTFESNYIERHGQTSQAFIAQEVWTLERRAGLLTQPPKPVTALSCPSCGFGGDFPASGVCPQCGTTNVRGDFDWVVSSIQVLNLETFSPHAAEGGGIEAGTSLATATHWDLARRREEFLTRHPEFLWSEFWNKASGIFLKLQQAWSDRDPSQCRPHETDVLFRMHRYWIEDYQRSKKINRLSDIDIDRWEISNVVLDAYYESITARVFAKMIDVTTDESGNVLYGDPKRARTFTEYWTFIRRIGNQPAQGDSLNQCPSCGAPLDRINQNGECEYCQTVVTLGDFDWVLSNIEQDEVYQLGTFRLGIPSELTSQLHL